MKRLAFFLIIIGLIAACKQTGNHATTPGASRDIARWPNGVAYEIFVQSYADADGDSIGDLNGLISRLDYLQDLGIKGVWLMPIMPSPSYHKYDVTDYYGIHPDYGNMAIFKRFVQEAHARDIKVVIDMIINHTSNQHPWFLNALHGDTARYRDYYLWASDEEIAATGAHEKELTGDSGNLTQWHKAKGNKLKYYGFFTGMMPDLNYDNPKVRQEVIKIGKFWLQDVGVDGLRLDAAKHIYDESRISDNHAWWVTYRKALQAVKPNTYLVGEVWDNADFVAPFLKGLPALFNFDLAFSMLESVRQEHSVSAMISGPSWQVIDTLRFETGYLHDQAIYQQQTNDYQDAIFLSNHDQNRILSMLGGNIKKGKLAAALLLSMPGTPYLYYGEEIGMLGMKPDPNIREPFLWADTPSDTMRTRWIKPAFTTDSTVRPLADQMHDSSSIYRQYRKLIHVRNSSRALTFGNFVDANYGNGKVISFYRETKKEKLLVFHNLSSQRVSIQLNDTDRSFGKVLFSTYGEQVSNDGVDIEPYSSVFLSE